MNVHVMPPDSASYALLDACGETPLTTLEITTRAGVPFNNNAILYRLRDLGLLMKGPQIPGRRRPNVTWVRTPAGIEALRRSATRLKPVEAHVLTCLSAEDQRANAIPCPAHLTRSQSPGSWRSTRCQVMRGLVEEGLIDWQRGFARLTELGLAALPDARVRLGLPEVALPTHLASHPAPQEAL